jgi:transposase InsO family protein
MKYELMAAHEGQYGVTRMCQVLGVGRSGYYAWRQRPESGRAKADRELVGEIRKQHQVSRESYGSPRMHHALREAGMSCGRHRVARLMRLHGIVALKAHKRRYCTTQRDRQAVPAPNLLGQNFSCQRPNEKWVGDVTYIRTSQGWLYLACVMDLFSRQIVGWAMSEYVDTKLVKAAWNMAVKQRKLPKGLLHHSDQGSTYTSEAFQQALKEYDCQISMSRVGNCYDNAAMESFFATLKTECAHHTFATRAEARTAIFEYIEGWYNRQRSHSSLGYLSPVQFEAQFRD